MSDRPVVLVTGASAGIGEATAWKFAQEGYRVVLAARRIDRLNMLADKIVAAGGEAIPIETDVMKLEQLERMVQVTLDQYDHIDVLINNAGFGQINWLENLDPVKDIEDQIRVNLLAVILTTRLVLPGMIERRSGHIINMDSISGLLATPTYSVYAASKFGVRGFSEALRREVGVFGIRVSVIYPGGVATEFKEIAGIKRKTGITTPSRLRLSAEQVANSTWLAVRHPKRTVVIPGFYRLAVAFNSVFPALVDWFIERKFVRIERGIPRI